ncbi:hypothetical protein BDZ85DRAFT_28561 [Elsinoe ampelina]|uniref:DUF6604 domain-containing protein n=1 Tax=Elsinoe ampelina TaxID=302913 RepID=A0A6A6G4A4_9PEZI|nr:hypothetical protein BDZ85DRAFT_28561 [Elsinoe ampelina]
MDNRNAYLGYKQDTQQLLHWMLRASNTIIKAGRSSDPNIKMNTTGQIKLVDILPVAHLIHDHVRKVPSMIFSMLQNIIAARTNFHRMYEDMCVNSSHEDPVLIASNRSHAHFISVLRAAFTVLGGDQWLTRASSGQGSGHVDDTTKGFLLLRLQSESETSDTEADTEQVFKSVHQKRPRKVKSKGKQTKEQRKTPQSATADLDDLPLQSYKILQDAETALTDYHMALHSLVLDYSTFRNQLQDIWMQVVYRDLNSAGAAALTKVAVAMIHRTEAMIAADFPGDEYYQPLLSAFQHNYQIGDIVASRTNSADESVAVDIEELLSVHTYKNLVDFLKDYKQNRTGRPTKRLRIDLDGWDPAHDLSRLNDVGRREWCRLYTINWLYDLVNAAASSSGSRSVLNAKSERRSADKGTTFKGQKWLPGLEEFGGSILALATNSSGSNAEPKVLPSVVFFLQIAVDSFVISKGWSYNVHGGHEPFLGRHTFHSRRDIERFLQWEDTALDFHSIIDLLEEGLEFHSCSHSKPYAGTLEALRLLREEIPKDYPRSPFARDSSCGHESRFAANDQNGLWTYSPMACGSALVEAMELATRVGMRVLDVIHESIMLIHVYNRMSHLDEIPHTNQVFELFMLHLPHACFADGKRPVKNFREEFERQIARQKAGNIRLREAALRDQLRRKPDLRSCLDVSGNKLFNQKSELGNLSDANWAADRIDDDALYFDSALARHRIGLALCQEEPQSESQKRLLARARAAGMTESILQKHKGTAKSVQPASNLVSMGAALAGPAVLRVGPIAKNSESADHSDNLSKMSVVKSKLEYLSLFTCDIFCDVAGDDQFAGLHMLAIAANLKGMYNRLMAELETAKSPVWEEALAISKETGEDIRRQLGRMLLETEDPGTIEVLSDLFHDTAMHIRRFSYWPRLGNCPNADLIQEESQVTINKCVVM